MKDFTLDKGISSLKVLTDSRVRIASWAESVFFALKTPQGNGHRFIQELYDRGVRNFVVSEPVDEAVYPGAQFHKVADTLSSLQEMAREHRTRFDKLRVVAVTGSRGKTMVKEWLSSLMLPAMEVVRSPRSFNSQIGVPLSLLNIGESSQLGIFEAGISKKGEMERLAEMISPDIVILTGIEEDHAEGFASKQQKIREKLQLAKDAHYLIYPCDDRAISQEIGKMVKSGQLKSQLFPWGHCQDENPLLHYETDMAGEGCTRLRLEGITPEGGILLPFAESWQVKNAVSCAAAMMLLGVKPEVIGERLGKLLPGGTRLEVLQGVNDSLLVRDDYTCDNATLSGALDFMCRRRGTDRRSMTAILSDLDDGDYMRAMQEMRQAGITRIIGIGEAIGTQMPALAADMEARFYSTTDEFLSTLSPGDFAGEMVLIKGTPAARFDRIVTALEARSHETVLEVNLDALADNYNFFRRHLEPSTGIVAMLKASGYGAGSYELAKTMQDMGAAYIAVAVADEGAELRDAGIRMPIMVLNPRVINYHTLFDNKLEPEVHNFEIFHELLEEAKRRNLENYPVHIKIDTGMHRLGFTREQLPQLLEELGAQSTLRVASVFSHLATADCWDMDKWTKAQLDYFDKCSSVLQTQLPYKFLRHILNTAGILRFPQYQYDMVRLGIGLYGVSILGKGGEALEKGLRPVSALHTHIISLKWLDDGDAVGYGRHGVIKRPSLIAAVPVGYADGINRHMGRGRCSFLVKGNACPTVGNICMDVCMIDVTGVKGVAIGDDVEVFGPHKPVEEHAKLIDTIPYEILTSVSPRVRRVYYRES